MAYKAPRHATIYSEAAQPARSTFIGTGECIVCSTASTLAEREHVGAPYQGNGSICSGGVPLGMNEVRVSVVHFTAERHYYMRAYGAYAVRRSKFAFQRLLGRGFC